MATKIAEEIILFTDTFVESVEGRIDEGKALGTVHPSKVVLARDLTTARDYHHAAFSKARKAGHDTGRRKLAAVRAHVLNSLSRAVTKFQQKVTDESVFRTDVTKLMKAAWRDVFHAGVNAGGFRTEHLEEDDYAWLSSGTKHEMRYLNGFLDDVVAGAGKMPYSRRVVMYADSLASFYESSRVIGMPLNTVIHWVGPDDKITCPGCRYLFENSPYTKSNLPTVPRSGSTACLVNCRDRLIIRRASVSEVQKIEESAKYTREQHIRNLRRIKATGV